MKGECWLLLLQEQHHLSWADAVARVLAGGQRLTSSEGLLSAVIPWRAGKAHYICVIVRRACIPVQGLLSAERCVRALSSLCKGCCLQSDVC